MVRIRVAWVWLLAVAAGSGQTPAGFEVAAIKPADPAATGTSTHMMRGQLVMENVSLKECVERAFHVKDYSLAGPSWLDSARFNIVAKPPEGAPREQFDEMLQTLLAERFGLMYHRESKILPAFALVVDKKGLKLKPVQANVQGGGWSMGRGRLTANQLTMRAFAEMLSLHLNHPVKDMTGLSEAYTIKLVYVPDDAPATEAPAVVDGIPAASSIFAALQEQAGLRLETQKLAIDILVVDRMERQPTEN